MPAKNIGAYRFGASGVNSAHPDYINHKNMLYLENDTGASMVTGDVGYVDTDGKVSLNTTANAVRRVVVVPYEVTGADVQGSLTIGAASLDFYQFAGLAKDVLIDGACTAGNYAALSATSKKLRDTGISAKDGLPPVGACGVIEETLGAAGPADVTLWGFTAGGLFGKSMSTDTPADGYSPVYRSATGMFELELASLFQELADESPSAVASVTISGIPQTYGDLELTGAGLPANDGVSLYLRANGYSGASDYSYVGSEQKFGAAAAGIASAGAAQAVFNGSYNIGNASNEGMAFRVEIPNYAQVIGSTQHRLMFLEASFLSTGSEPSLGDYRGALLKAEAVTSLTLLFSAGNIANMRLRLFGKGN